TDQVLQQPLQGASVSLAGTGLTAVTDASGIFRFKNIPVGTYRLVISYTGYKDGLVENMIVNSGKEAVINIALESAIRSEQEVVVKATSKKDKPLNDMSVV